MGQVYLGKTRAGRLVAVKVMRSAHAADGEWRRRFAQEIAAATLVGGFHTAQVIASDPDAELPWMATAYIPGPSLAAKVGEHGPLAPGVVRDLGAALAEALDAIHAKGIIHRDLKPANIIMADDGPWIIDFGIAKAPGASALTSAGTAVGTLLYMSPEQVRGRPAGPYSDIFSLGSVLVYAATGHSPFQAPDDLAIMRRIDDGEPHLGPIAGPFREVITGCLAKDPADRLTAIALRDALLAAVPAVPEVPAASPPAEDVHAPTMTAQGAVADIAAPPGAGAARRGYPATLQAATPRSRSPEQMRPQLQVRPASGTWSALAFDPFGQWLATADGDGTITVWDAISGLPVRSWSAQGHVRVMAASPQRLLAVGGDGGSVRIWDAETGVVHGSFPGRAGRLRALSFDGTGTLLAVGDARGTIWLGKTGGETLSSVSGPARSAVRALAVDWPGHLLAAGSEDGKVRVWDVGDPCEPVLLAELPGTTRASAVAFGAASQQLAVGGMDGKVRVWTLGRVSRGPLDPRPADGCAAAHSGAVLSVAWDATASQWISAGADGSVGHEARQTAIVNRPLRAAAVITLGHGAVIDDREGRVHVFRAGDPGRVRCLEGTGTVVSGIAFAGSDDLLVMGGSDGALHLWDARRHTMRAVGVADRPITALGGSPTGTRVAVCRADGQVSVYDVAGQSIAPRWTRQCPEPVPAVAFGPGGKWLVTAGDAVRVWDAANGTLDRELPGGTRRAKAIAVEAGGHCLAAGGADGVVRFWDEGRRLRELTGHKGSVDVAAFGPVAGRLVTAGSDGTIRIWGLRGHEEVRCLSGLEYRGRALAANPASGVLAVGCADGTVRLQGPPGWTGGPVLTGHVHAVTAMSLSANGQLLATASMDGTARVWDLAARSTRLVLVPGATGWAAAQLLRDGTCRGYGDTDGRLWHAVGLSREPLHGIETGTA
jgi:WD40 repeat protein